MLAAGCLETTYWRATTKFIPSGITSCHVQRLRYDDDDDDDIYIYAMNGRHKDACVHACLPVLVVDTTQMTASELPSTDPSIIEPTNSGVPIDFPFFSPSIIRAFPSIDQSAHNAKLFSKLPA
jgi:hypothetical protein